jgi:hypothetical protein
MKIQQKIHPDRVECMVEGDQHALPVPDCLGRKMARMVHVVTVAAERDQIRQLVWSIFSDRPDVVNVKGDDIPTDRPSALVTCLHQNRLTEMLR